MVVLFVWEVSLHSQVDVFTIHAHSVVRAIQDVDDGRSYLIEVSLVLVEAMLEHEEEHSEDLVGQLAQTIVLQPHQAVLIDEVVFTELFHAVK